MNRYMSRTPAYACDTMLLCTCAIMNEYYFKSNIQVCLDSCDVHHTVFRVVCTRIGAWRVCSQSGRRTNHWGHNLFPKWTVSSITSQLVKHEHTQTQTRTGLFFALRTVLLESLHKYIMSRRTSFIVSSCFLNSSPDVHTVVNRPKQILCEQC